MHELTRSQIEIQKMAKEFVKDLALFLGENASSPKDIQEKAAEQGFIGIHFDEGYQSGGMGAFENILLAQELCRKDSSIDSALMLSAHGFEHLL